jgi:hypothetical protein
VSDIKYSVRGIFRHQIHQGIFVECVNKELSECILLSAECLALFKESMSLFVLAYLQLLTTRSYSGPPNAQLFSPLL